MVRARVRKHSLTTRYGLSFDLLAKVLSLVGWNNSLGECGRPLLTNNGGTSNEIQITYAEADLRNTNFQRGTSYS